MTQEGLEFIQSQVSQGIADDDIRNALLSNGFKQTDIDQTIASVKAATPPPNNLPFEQAPAQPRIITKDDIDTSTTPKQT